MKPVAVLPYKDPQGIMIDHFRETLPLLKDTFEKAVINITVDTLDNQEKSLGWLFEDDFFIKGSVPGETLIGDHFRALYQQAITTCSDEQVFHLCFVDRLVYALSSHFRDQFLSDILSINAENTPLIFHRSEEAWKTHPKIYRELESVATTAGEILFSKSLDFAWCHLVLTCRQLRAIAGDLTEHTLGVVGELVLLLLDEIKTKDVDWLSWEDPFIFGCDAVQLRQARETSVQDVQKRLSYMAPILQLIYNTSLDRNVKG